MDSDFSVSYSIHTDCKPMVWLLISRINIKEKLLVQCAWLLYISSHFSDLQKMFQDLHNTLLPQLIVIQFKSKDG